MRAAGQRIVAVAGSPRGQLFHELEASCPDDVRFVALCGADGQRLDVTDAEAVARAVQQVEPDALINASAYTAVDKAEQEAAAAQAVNADGAAHLAQAARDSGAHLVHVSTDFVFGASDGRPYATDAPTDPLGVYGRSKREGEYRVSEILPSASIVRTAWVYSAHGQNFVKTMLRLMGEREELGVVADQVGSPTWARSLGSALWQAAAKRPAGIFHWTGAGVASWYDFAKAIHDEGRARGLLTRDVTIRPLSSAQYPTPAARPAYSVLELDSTRAALELDPAHWRDDLSRMLGELV